MRTTWRSCLWGSTHQAKSSRSNRSITESKGLGSNSFDLVSSKPPYVNLDPFAWAIWLKSLELPASSCFNDMSLYFLARQKFSEYILRDISGGSTFRIKKSTMGIAVSVMTVEISLRRGEVVLVPRHPPLPGWEGTFSH